MTGGAGKRGVRYGKKEEKKKRGEGSSRKAVALEKDGKQLEKGYVSHHHHVRCILYYYYSFILTLYNVLHSHPLFNSVTHESTSFVTFLRFHLCPFRFLYLTHFCNHKTDILVFCFVVLLIPAVQSIRYNAVTPSSI